MHSALCSSRSSSFLFFIFSFFGERDQLRQERQVKRNVERRERRNARASTYTHTHAHTRAQTHAHTQTSKERHTYANTQTHTHIHTQINKQTSKKESETGPFCSVGSTLTSMPHSDNDFCCKPHRPNMVSVRTYCLGVRFQQTCHLSLTHVHHMPTAPPRTCPSFPVVSRVMFQCWHLAHQVSSAGQSVCCPRQEWGSRIRFVILAKGVTMR